MQLINCRNLGTPLQQWWTRLWEDVLFCFHRSRSRFKGIDRCVRLRIWVCCVMPQNKGTSNFLASTSSFSRNFRVPTAFLRHPCHSSERFTCSRPFNSWSLMGVCLKMNGFLNEPFEGDFGGSWLTVYRTWWHNKNLNLCSHVPGMQKQTRKFRDIIYFHSGQHGCVKKFLIFKGFLGKVVMAIPGPR